MPALVFFSCTKPRVEPDVPDDTPPEITLSGPSAATVILNGNYSEPGYQAYDDRDGNITQKVSVKGAVNRNMASVYYITYSVSDENGNAAGVRTRTVTVRNEVAYLQGEYSVTSACNNISNGPGLSAIAASYTLNNQFTIILQDVLCTAVANGAEFTVSGHGISGHGTITDSTYVGVNYTHHNKNCGAYLIPGN